MEIFYLVRQVTRLFLLTATELILNSALEMEFVSELQRSPETRIMRILRALRVSYSVQRFDGF